MRIIKLVKGFQLDYKRRFMSILARVEFAKMCDVTPGNLSNFIKRGKVVLEDDGISIDTKKHLNKVFFNARVGKGLVAGKVARAKAAPKEEPKPKVATKKPLPTKKRTVSKESDDLEDEDGSPAALKKQNTDELDADDIIRSEIMLKKFKALNAEADNVLKQYEIERKTGKVIPSEPVIPVIKQHNMFILSAMKVAFESTLTEISHTYSISTDHVAMYRSIVVDKLNTAILDATRMTEESLEGIIDEFVSTKK